MTIESIKAFNFNGTTGVFVMFILKNGEAYEMTFENETEAIGYMNAINAA